MTDDDQQQLNFREQVEEVLRQRRPVVRESMTDEESENLRSIYGVLREFLSGTFEEFERGFLRHEQPDDLIRRYQVMAAVYHLFTVDHRDADEAERFEAFTNITFVTTGLPKPESTSADQWAQIGGLFSRLFKGEFKVG